MTYAEERKAYEELHTPTTCKLCGKQVNQSKQFKINGTICDDCRDEEFKEEEW